MVKKSTKKIEKKKDTKETKVLKKHELKLPKVAVIGVGGSGKNVTNYMIKKDVKGVKFIAINTDLQDLNQSKAQKKIYIGKNLTQGTGTGMDPEIGKKAAMESKEEIANALKDVQMIFLAGGFGGGTGTGATPVISSIAKDLGILTIAIVTKPFSFEGQQRKKLAEKGLRELEQNIDAYITIENDRILETAKEDAGLEEAFALSDEVLRQAVEGISELITKPGKINIDYSDIKKVLKESGLSLIGIGVASGKERAKNAAEASINSPLINLSTDGARSILFSISAPDEIKMNEISEIAKIITEKSHPDAMIKFGTSKNTKLKKGALKVTVVASNFNEFEKPEITEIESFGIKIKEEIEEPKDFETKEEIDNKFKFLEEKKKKRKIEDKTEKEKEDESLWVSLFKLIKRKK